MQQEVKLIFFPSTYTAHQGGKVGRVLSTTNDAIATDHSTS